MSNFQIKRSKHFSSKDDSKMVAKEVLYGEHRDRERVKEFEIRMKNFIGVKYAKATNSGTSALHLALLSLNIKKNDEVIIPTYICQSVMHAVNYTRAKPILADIDRDFDEKGYNISVGTIKNLITKKTKAIILAHMFGMPADIYSIKKFGIPIIEDCAHSLGAEYKGEKIGSIGDISIFSFYSTKIISTGQGGMIATSSDKIFDKIKDLTDYDQREFSGMAYNYSLSDIQAALGISQLNKLDYFLNKREKIGKIYNAAFSKTSLILLPKVKGAIQYRYIIRTSSKEEREKLEKGLENHGIEAARPIFKPLHQYLNLNKNNFRNSEKIHETALTLPSYPALTDKEIEKVKFSVLKSLE